MVALVVACTQCSIRPAAWVGRRRATQSANASMPGGMSLTVRCPPCAHPFPAQFPIGPITAGTLCQTFFPEAPIYSVAADSVFHMWVFD